MASPQNSNRSVTASNREAALETHFCQQLQSLSSVRRWVIAHSGGLDSQVLLHLASRYIPQDQLLVVHVNHQLQAEAEQWSLFSAKQAHALGIAHQILLVQPDSDSEDAARRARYDAFTGLLQSGDVLLQGHHADDQAETLLFRMLRGSGLQGLVGIPGSRPLGQGVLFRPLLSMTRESLEAYAAELRLEYVIDPSNHDTKYDRNFLRHRVLPVIAERWPDVSHRWARVTEQLEKSQQALNAYLDEDIEAALGQQFELDLSLLGKRDRGRQQQLLRRWCERAGGQLLNLRQLNTILDSVVNAADDASPVFRLGSLSVRRYRQHLYLVADVTSEREELKQLCPGEYVLSDGTLKIRVGTYGLKTLDGVRMVRRKGGERCRPVGRGGSRTVKQCLQEAGIAPWLKQDWPLLVHEDEVVAIPGVCICEGWQKNSNGIQVSWCCSALSETG